MEVRTIDMRRSGRFGEVGEFENNLGWFNEPWRVRWSDREKSMEFEMAGERRFEVEKEMVVGFLKMRTIGVDVE